MKMNYINGLFMLAAGAFVASCADYNVTDDFVAEKDPTFVEPYKDLAPVKSYIDREKFSNMSLGATLNVSDFNKQELAHAAAVTNFDNYAFGKGLMSGSIVNAKGAMNFIDMKDLLDHVEEIGGEVFGSPIVANSNQADSWMNMLTAPIEVPVDFVEGKKVNYNDSTAFNGTKESGSASIGEFEGKNVLIIGTKKKPKANIRIIEGFEVDSLAKYTITFYARSATNIDASFTVNFSGTEVEGTGLGGKWPLPAGTWRKFVVENLSVSGVKEGFLRIGNTNSSVIYIQNVELGYFPSNQRPQTAQEKKDTVTYALNKWCDELMKTNAGRIKSFDLIDEAIDTKSELENGMYDLKHSTDKIFWQDIFGSENYAPTVARTARKAFEKHGGDPAELKFFISESGLDNAKKMESLNYWIKLWDDNGAKIDGINAKVSLTYFEDEARQAANVANINTLLDNLAATEKLIRLSNFDVLYRDADNNNVSAKDITEEQRQKLADFNAYVIKSYLTKIPNDRQAGICKGNISDTSDPVGLWSIDTRSKDWVRTATYKAFCNALSGE